MGIISNTWSTGVLPTVIAGGLFIQLFLLLLVLKRTERKKHITKF